MLRLPKRASQQKAAFSNPNLVNERYGLIVS
jgi:hypothetical protein